MQDINIYLLNSTQISLQDLHNNNSQIQNSNNMNNNHQHQQQSQPQLNQSTTTPHLDPTAPHDDFLEQMLSNLPSCSWSDVNPNKHPENVAFPYDEHASLASKFRNHQISASSPAKTTAAAALMLQMPLSHMAGNDIVDASQPFKSHNQGAEASIQSLYNGFPGSLHGSGQASNHTHPFQLPQGQNFAALGVGAATNQAAASGASGGGAAVQPKQRVRARRGQATDPHSIAERLRRERIAERMKALQELVPNANKTDKASMLDEIIDYVKFLQLQVKVLSMSRLGGATAVTPLVADMSSERGGDCIQTNGVRSLPQNSNDNQTTSTSNDGLTMTEHQVAKLMEEDMGSAMQYLQGKGLCLMPISLATAISTTTCHTRNTFTNAGGSDTQISNSANCRAGVDYGNPGGEGPPSPNMSVLTVQSAIAGSDGVVKEVASILKP